MLSTTFLQRLAILLIGCFAVVHNAGATIVAQRDGPVNYVLGNYGQYISFTTSDTYDNVSISATLSSLNFSNNGAGTIYLTNQLGTGTTVANQLGSVSLSNLEYATFGSLNTLLFSGLTLLPGTYYLSAFGAPNSGGLGFVGTYTPIETLDVGVSIDVDHWMSGSAAPYLPASSEWTTFKSELIFSVVSENSNVVPEPSSLLLLGLATFSLGLIRLGKQGTISRTDSIS